MHVRFPLDAASARKLPKHASAIITSTANIYRGSTPWVKKTRHLTLAHNQWRRQGEGGEASPYGWTSKNYVICVCFHCHGTNTLQGRRAKSHVDAQTIQPGLGASYSRPPIEPYLTSPLLQNPGGATAHNFTKYWPFFKILSLLDSVGNL